MSEVRRVDSVARPATRSASRRAVGLQLAQAALGLEDPRLHIPQSLLTLIFQQLKIGDFAALLASKSGKPGVLLCQ
jgi:hypothetical protein